MADENNPGQQGQDQNNNPNQQQTLVTDPAAANAVPEWQKGLAQEFQGHMTLKPYGGDINNLVKDLIETKKMVGADKVTLPGEKATPEERAAFYEKLGRPKTADEYGFKVPDNIPAGVRVDEAGIKGVAQLMHEAGLSKQQAQSIFDGYMKMQTETAGELAKELYLDPTASKAKLQEVWGQATDERIAEVNQVLAPVYEKMPWVKEWLENTQLGNAAPFLAIMSELAIATRESGTPHTGKVAADGKVTPAEAQAEMGKLMLDQEFMKAWLDNGHPGHAAAVKRYQDLAMQTDPNPQVLFDAADYGARPRSAS